MLLARLKKRVVSADSTVDTNIYSDDRFHSDDVYR